MRLYFLTGNGMVEKIIKFFSRARYKGITHVVADVMGYCYESKHSTGVIKTPILEWMAVNAHKVVAEVELGEVNTQSVQRRLDAKVGAPYDWEVLWSFPFYKTTHAPERWMCSELVAYALQDYIPHDHYHQITPVMLYDIVYAMQEYGK